MNALDLLALSFPHGAFYLALCKAAGDRGSSIRTIIRTDDAAHEIDLMYAYDKEEGAR